MSDSMGRRRSVDVGGLALALSDENQGHGWGGWEETDCGETRYAEVLIDVRAHTETMVSQDCEHFNSCCVVLNRDTHERLIHSLSSWHFEPHKLPEEEVIACSYILFEALYRIENMQETVSVSLGSIATFLQHLCQLYRQANTYHNLQHALDVFQAVYFFLTSAGAVPPVTILLEDGRTWKRDREASDPLVGLLTDEDLFALCIAAVGHDVGHPGLNNAFMKNAKTPLAVVYDDKSVLEQMHYSLILQIMRHHNLSFLLDRPTAGPLFRQLLLKTVLATDMGIHFNFMTDFRDMLAGADLPEFQRRILVCQALIKCADISNPSRPYLVSQHWATALESEWSSQLLLEKHLQLPSSVKPSDSRIGEANSQIWFNTTFARPLFELIAQGIPSFEQFASQSRENLALWQTRAAELAAQPNELSPDAPETPLTWPSQAPNDFLTAFPPTLPESFRQPEEMSYPMVYHHHHRLSSVAPSTSSSSSTPSQYESCESSLPSPTFSPVLEPASASPPASPSIQGSLPPRLELPQSRPQSVASNAPSTSASVFSITNEATAAIRAAYKASVRKKKSFHRSSWNPSPTAMSSLSQTPPPVPGPAVGRSPVSPAGSGDSPLSLSGSSHSTGTLTPSPLTPDGNATQARQTLLKTALVSASS
ncbi:HD-domain/PDEase-like protein [Trametes versicolor FP-101664 SS1]|uniref:HD-domain/PDEase-like protein n=1 Tax=Trametes versicolor (strain FP-101664) TaxID=717944 RepID=UPI0004622D32|nr:HD-domain/PDEase-like protein [Trametes versicolor FP-101664 SS1]EIW55345.1 HD-domain/PDEase-like protein [Trametes versicolor FP-101664 SS1]